MNFETHHLHVSTYKENSLFRLYKIFKYPPNQLKTKTFIFQDISMYTYKTLLVFYNYIVGTFGKLKLDIYIMDLSLNK